MNYIGMAITILSHIAAGLYLEKPKYNKVVIAASWLMFAVVSVAVMSIKEMPQTVFFGILIAQYVTFLLTSCGPAGEKTFLFLTYANSFCVSLGVRQYLAVFFGNEPYCFGNEPYFFVIELVILVLMHLLLCTLLLPNYKRARIFFRSGWLKINLILIFFFIQFLNQYAFSVVNKHEAMDTVLDFALFGIILYSTLFFMFDAVKIASETNKRKFENNELKNLAYIDQLTKLQNRTSYIKYVRRLTLDYRMNKIKGCVCVVMDIDGFKQINDELGHAEGDRILMETGSFMIEYLEEFNCKIFRIGGDEFVLFLHDVNITDIQQEMDSMNRELQTKVGTTMSCGWAEIDFKKHNPVETAFDEADKMMYDNKQSKKSIRSN